MEGEKKKIPYLLKVNSPQLRRYHALLRIPSTVFEVPVFIYTSPKGRSYPQ